ncbi:MAG: gliding motility-associated ABC transporter substrate-binding protein GldG [Bacteroidota bacterium]
MVNLDSKRLEDILKLLIGLAVLAILNLLGGQFFYRFDLTEEKRFSIKQATKELLQELDDIVYVEVYLDGELNARLKRLQRSIRETLEEFRVYSDNNIQYVFNDPSTAMSEKAQDQFRQNLTSKGIQATNVIYKENGQRIEKIIFPGAIVSYGGAEQGVMLLKGNQASTDEEKLNQSIEGVEYELAAAIRKLTDIDRKRVGIVRGQGELDSLEMAGLSSVLAELYDVRPARLEDNDLLKYDALIIAKPTRKFEEEDKYWIDQYLMNGGKLMMLLDKLQANMDSVSTDFNFAFPYDLNLDDALFKYGVRVNPDLIQDNSAARYPVVIGTLGDQPQISWLDWWFFPVINRFADHPITKNIDGVLGRFASTIDTVKAEGVKKTPLLFTSDYSRTVTAPVNVAIAQLRKDLTPDKFTARNLPVSYLLEGQFESLYKNRFKPIENDPSFKSEALEGAKLVVVSDGDIARNEVNPRTGRPQQLGFYPFTNNNINYANEDFLVNALSYMLDEDGLITARNKDIKIRPLDDVKVNREKLKWQLINVLLPVLVVILYGIVRFYLRKRKYTGFDIE